MGIDEFKDKGRDYYACPDADNVELHPCDPNPCQNGGVCHAEESPEGGRSCSCPAGFTGDICENAAPARQAATDPACAHKAEGAVCHTVPTHSGEAQKYGYCASSACVVGELPCPVGGTKPLDTLCPGIMPSPGSKYAEAWSEEQTRESCCLSNGPVFYCKNMNAEDIVKLDCGGDGGIQEHNTYNKHDNFDVRAETCCTHKKTPLFDPCDPSPCRNGGTCAKVLSDDGGWSGYTCDCHDYGEGDEVKGVDLAAQFRTPIYSGPTCETEPQFYMQVTLQLNTHSMHKIAVPGKKRNRFFENFVGDVVEGLDIQDDDAVVITSFDLDGATETADIVFRVYTADRATAQGYSDTFEGAVADSESHLLTGLVTDKIKPGTVIREGNWQFRDAAVAFIILIREVRGH